MSRHGGSEVTISAAEQGLVDLDEFQPCSNLAKKIDGIECRDNIQSITLRLDNCWVEYSFSHLFLDKALEILLASDYSGRKKLTITLGINLGEAQFMAALLFRLSRYMSCEHEHHPKELLRRISDFGSEKNVLISIVSEMRLPGEDELRIQEFVLVNLES